MKEFINDGSISHDSWSGDDGNDKKRKDSRIIRLPDSSPESIAVSKMGKKYLLFFFLRKKLSNAYRNYIHMLE